MSHDEATHQAYRWGEDGLLGITDDQCNLCLSLALWNGNDPILKERLYGLTNAQVSVSIQYLALTSMQPSLYGSKRMRHYVNLNLQLV